MTNSKSFRAAAGGASQPLRVGRTAGGCLRLPHQESGAALALAEPLAHELQPRVQTTEADQPESHQPDEHGRAFDVRIHGAGTNCRTPRIIRINANGAVAGS